MTSLRKVKLRILTLFASFALSVTASAMPVVWTLNGITLQDGSTVSGSFTFDADSTVACSTGDSPCGTYSNVDITTTAGGGLAAATYLYTCGTDVVTCMGVSPDSTEVLFLTSNELNQTGMQGLALFFAGVSGTPPMGLTDAGGTINVSYSSNTAGGVTEGICNDAACDAPNNPASSTAGFVVAATAVAVPEPSSLVLALLPFTAAVLFRRKWTPNRAS